MGSRVRICKKAFTLIELLVVVSIISVLVSLLLPALGAAREQAKAVICMSNLTQYGKAFLYYADDNNGFLAPSCQADGGQPWWWNLMAPYLKGGDTINYGFSEIYSCPSDPDNNNTYAMNRKKGYDGYYFASNPKRKFHQISPHVVLVIDQTGGTVHLAYASAWLNWWDNPPRPLVSDRHNGKANSVFFDLHVDAMPVADYAVERLW